MKHFLKIFIPALLILAILVAAGWFFFAHRPDLTMSVFGAALGMAALQALWFTGAVFRKLAYPARIAGFGACGLPVLALCAWAGPWFPLDDPGVWAAFALVYLFILAGVTAGYTIYFKKTAGGYDQALARYREKNRR